MPRTDPGERIYAIGDVHGCYDLMRRLIDRIGAHHAALPAPRALHIIFLGDLIDRGPDSAGVLDFVWNLQAKSDRVITLLGNHEEAMLGVIDGDTTMLRPWLGFGGRDTLRSFGLEPPSRAEDPRAFARRLQSAVPRGLVRWLRSLPLTAQSGDYFFCHAGVRPEVPLGRQTRQDLLWIRDDFLSHQDELDAVIVHGHSIEPECVIRPHRIGIDSGAYATGRLSAIYLEDDRQEIITIS